MKRVFYDLETTNEFPAYCDMTLCGALVESTGEKDQVFVWEAPWTPAKLEGIRSVICAPDIQRIGFNNLNFDDLVLHNHGITVPEEGTEDAMLALKAFFPGLPSYALKFNCWLLLGDPHWAEFELQQTGHKFDDTVSDELRKYHRHDLEQHRALWNYIEHKAKNLSNWDAYCLDMAMKFPLQEMIFDGGCLVDTKKAEQTLKDCEIRKGEIQTEISKQTQGKIKNANSNKQVGNYLATVENFELDLTKTGEFQVKKKDLVDIIGMSEDEMRDWRVGMKAPLSPVALLAWQMKDIETLRKYVKNYHTAAIETGADRWIPSSYSISSAATRRTLSKSFYKINFQNSTEAIDEFKLVPPGYLAWWIDSTQIENVVHIYESEDTERRLAYEADEEWNEYVWLCNMILGDTKTKTELDSIKSKQVPHWSVYKVYKTAKLSLNFGQGPKAFSEKLGLDIDLGREVFQDIHHACPTIKKLQRKVEHLLSTQGYVQDVFGHIYTGSEAYKVVAYLIQGCGTGSLPKAQIRANYDTLNKWSNTFGNEVGCLMGTTHDECSGFLNLELGETNLTEILQELCHNMTSKFQYKFDNIPLRAKLYLSTTNHKDRKNHEQPNWRHTIQFPK